MSMSTCHCQLCPPGKTNVMPLFEVVEVRSVGETFATSSTVQRVVVLSAKLSKTVNDDLSMLQEASAPQVMVKVATGRRHRARLGGLLGRGERGKCLDQPVDQLLIYFLNVVRCDRYVLVACMKWPNRYCW